MELLMMLAYTAVCIVIFRLFKIPLNKWTVPTAALGGVTMISTVVILMNYNHPYAELGRQYFVTTPIVPNVSGQVIEVGVRGHEMLEQGDVLFRIDPQPFENRVRSLVAQELAARLELERKQGLYQAKAISERELELARADFDDVTAQLALAQYELDQATVRAPSRGYATQVALRPGMRAVSMPLRPVMVFVGDEDHYLVGWFRQNSLLRIEVGSRAEVAFDGIPGTVFQGEVEVVAPTLAEGQIIASGDLVNTPVNPRPGRAPVLVRIDDPAFAEYAGQIPGGAHVEMAIYSEHFHHLAKMRQILLRASSWLKFLFPFH